MLGGGLLPQSDILSHKEEAIKSSESSVRNLTDQVAALDAMIAKKNEEITLLKVSPPWLPTAPSPICTICTALHPCQCVARIEPVCEAEHPDQAAATSL
jgi:hypothetical protein